MHVRRSSLAAGSGHSARTGSAGARAPLCARRAMTERADRAGDPIGPARSLISGRSEEELDTAPLTNKTCKWLLRNHSKQLPGAQRNNQSCERRPPEQKGIINNRPRPAHSGPLRFRSAIGSIRKLAGRARRAATFADSRLFLKLASSDGRHFGRPSDGH